MGLSVQKLRLTAFLLCSLFLGVHSQTVYSNDDHPPDTPPDIDGQGPNNTIDGAIDTQLRADPSRPGETASVSGELGTVALGFDSVDHYGFGLSQGNWSVTLNLTETPNTTMWLAVYNSNREQIAYSRGQDNEELIFTAPGGGYYIAVLTDRAVAGNRLLRYTLKITPKFLPLPEAGGRTCQSGTNLGNLASAPQTVKGTIEGVNAASFFRFYVPRYFNAEASAQVFLPPKYTAVFVDDLTAKQIQPKWQALSLDPGYYCLKVFNPQIPGPVEYQVASSATPTSFIPASDRAQALALSQLELGNLTENGYYVKTRYIRYQDGPAPNIPLELQVGHEYVLRDWVGNAQQNEWYSFSIAAPRRIELRLYNLYYLARVTIENAQGEIVATSFSEGDSLIDGRLPNQVLSVSLPSGRYYLRINYAGTESPGTSFGLWLRALDQTTAPQPNAG